MKNKVLVIVSLIFGFILGIIFTGIAVNISSGKMMVKEIKSPYDFDKTVEVLSDRINNLEGWHVTGIIDQSKEVAENGGFPVGHYKIIKYCSGSFSARMLQADDRKFMGTMMPKSFSVYQKSDGQVYVATFNGAILGKIFGGEVEKIIEEVSLDVEKMMSFINFKTTTF